MKAREGVYLFKW